MTKRGGAMATERFQGLSPLEKTAIAGVIAAVVVVVLLLSVGRAAPAVFLMAAAGGGWAAVRTLDGGDRGPDPRSLLPLLPDLVDRRKGKRPQAGLAVRPDFDLDLGRYSLKNCHHDHRGESDQTRTRRSRAIGSTESGGSSWSGRLLSVTVDEELQSLFKSIMVEFVMSWYGEHVSGHGEVPGEFRRHLLSAGENVCGRLASFGRRALFGRALGEFAAHVHRFQRARASLRRLRGRDRPLDSGSLVDSYETSALMHPATEDAAAARGYLKAVARVVLDGALPGSVTDCRASALILTDILASNVLLPLVALLAEPGFLYRVILLIVSSAVDDADMPGQDGGDTSSGTGTLPSQTSKLSESGLGRGEAESSAPPSFQSQVDSTVDDKQKRDAGLDSDVNDIFEPRLTTKPDLQRGSVRSGSPLKGRPNLARVQSDSCLPSPASRHLLSRSLDALSDGGPDQIRTPDKSFPGSATSTRSVAGHRRTASDSLLNPARDGFIPGGQCPVGRSSECGDTASVASVPGVTSTIDDSRPSGSTGKLHAAGTSTAPRCWTGSGGLRGYYPVPMTMLEPARTLRPRTKASERPKSWAGDSEAAASCIDPAEVHLRDAHCSSGGGLPAISPADDDAISRPDDERGRPIGNRLGPKAADDCRGAGTEEEQRSTREDGDCSRLDDLLPTDRPAASAPVAEPSSSFRKLLRRVSLSKKGKSVAPRSDASAPRTATIPTSQPMAMPIPARQFEISAERDPSPSTLSTVQPTSEAGSGEDFVGQPADRPRHISGSAPESLDVLLLSDGTATNHDLASWEVTNLTIPVTEVRKDIGGMGEFFLYLIQFDVSVSSAESSRLVDPQLCKRIIVRKTTKRRHREFVNLHSRLEHNPKLKKSLKGIGDVPKRLSIPIAPTAKAAVDQRRISLQRYLQKLLATPLLKSSSELASFLALEGDTHIEYVRHQPREYVPRIDKLLRNRVSDLMDSLKSALPKALSESAPPPASTTSSSQRSAASHEVGRQRGTSPPASPRGKAPVSTDEQDGKTEYEHERVFAFERRPKTTLQLAMGSVIQDYNDAMDGSLGTRGHPEGADISTKGFSSSSSDDPEPSDAVKSAEPSEMGGPSTTEDVALFNALMGLLREAFPDRRPWFVSERFQQALRTLAGGLLDGWVERQIDLLLSEHWCAFYLAELRESLWPNGELLSGSQEAGTRSAATEEALGREALTSLLDLMPESFYCVVDKDDWREGLQLLLDSLSDPHLNRHLVFVALDLLMDAVMTEVKDESYQKDLLARI